jgi:hypothetical protein
LNAKLSALISAYLFLAVAAVALPRVKAYLVQLALRGRKESLVNLVRKVFRVSLV